MKKRLEEICAPKHIKEDRTLENRRIVFEDMEKKNIPDIVIDMSEGDQELCCILDAKYSGGKIMDINSREIWIFINSSSIRNR